ncbi:isoprenylcysteine carboxylmethyltransferase family protein [Vibrio sp.]|uniref:Isoprenylcysteine carboxylmethyltransferase family protein n=1 Tax=Vibrio viridaestus TaxID=2487322 RepID=A0A3N9THP3_9VIBR|nr:isoprenylcysteine carboxylmethyltransferase family protein [Vibrio viridaestus]MDC0609697.1 isoprenylcysteine carboxylmethyltransferase family protein [Vibrio sp.]RQW63404.1 isoprenylcysteine carboxylmethyltransferase family protein [Vibrio viridaestus]
MELKIPPVIVFIIAVLAIYGIGLFDASLSLFDTLSLWCAIAFFIMSGIFGCLGVLSFKLSSTTVNPMEPEKASQIVSSGIFRLSRNPMYLGLLFLLISYCFFLQTAFAFLVCVLFVLYMNRFQIYPEERVLEAKFGQDYQQYKSRVRRWI